MPFPPFSDSFMCLCTDTQDKEEDPVFGAMNLGISEINLPAVYIANGMGICLLTVILYGRHKRLRDKTRDGILYRWMCRLCLILCILETCGFILDGNRFYGARQVAVLCNATILFLAVTMAYLWVCYVNSKLCINRRQTRAGRFLTAVPAGVIGLMTLANLFVPVFFVVNEANVYHRTPWFLLPCLVVYAYTAWGAIQSYRYQRRTDRQLFIPVLMFLVPVYVGSLIQLFCYGISLIWVSVAVGLTCLYINLQSEQAYLDPLTKLYNRGYLLQYMDHVFQQAGKGNPITGIMLDINDFKKINDTLGHVEGDQVLQAVGKILLRAAGNNTVVRYGGDEFIILLETSKSEQVQKIMDNIQWNLRSYNASRGTLPAISFSMGTAKFDQMNIFRFFQDMDMRMYEEKREFYLRKEMHEVSSNDK